MDSEFLTVNTAGLILGACYGMIARWNQFCFYRGLVEFWQGNSRSKLQGFCLAMLVAVLSSQAVSYFFVIDLKQTPYHPAQLSIPLVFIGALIFGYGMHLANACGARSLVLFAGGNLRSLLVLLVLGISASATLSGFLAPVRIHLQSMHLGTTSVTYLPAFISPAGFSPTTAQFSLTLLICIVLGGLVGYRNDFSRHKRQLFGSIAIGLLIGLAWWVTGVLGNDDFNPTQLASLTFVAPLGNSIQYVMLASGMDTTFPISVIGGILLGSFFQTLISREFRVEAFESVKQMQRSLLGAFFMGVGGVFAMGCTLGQGLSGLSTLATSSLIALLGIYAGARIGLFLDHRLR